MKKKIDSGKNYNNIESMKCNRNIINKWLLNMKKKLNNGNNIKIRWLMNM